MSTIRSVFVFTAVYLLWTGSGLTEETATERRLSIPPRPPSTPDHLIDLSANYNGSLTEGWTPSSAAGTKEGKALVIPLGLDSYGGVDFDVRGVIQLSGERLRTSGGNFPEKVEGVVIGMKGKRIHVLHASGWGNGVERGTEVGSFILKYEDGEEARIPIRRGFDVFDWVAHIDDEGENARRVWNGKTKNGLPVRLFMSSWENPEPDKMIKSLDYISLMTATSPFLVAVTLEH